MIGRTNANSNLIKLTKYDKSITPTTNGWGYYGTINISDIDGYENLVLDKNLIVQQYYFGKEGSHWDEYGNITIIPSYNADTGIITMNCNNKEGYYSSATYKAYVYVLG